ncbi:putative ribonuclease [Sphingomonas changbaiensis NBRC 104936]|uniref:Putative ribonuclease n=1 Tax=Sphingomonas changbaiensis NBRC 104936 TaxID=1219043 RepID=A0A0E9MRW4_9SPHN|nr:YihY/virulence factor BrkB family protein [Sphingomonas changbaiensis]GAO40166.1 putative ribonuclease [Sphingomonas changbaiensis NBRC 104936]
MVDAETEFQVEGPAPQSPEARRRRLIKAHAKVDETLKRLGPGSRFREILHRALSGVWNDGFSHAGNIAYLTLLTLFPFFIVVAALAHAFGQGATTARAVSEFLSQVPRNVADVLQKPINDVLLARSGTLLWLGALGGLWSAGGFIATIKDIIYRAYGVRSQAPFWRARLRYTATVIGSVVLVLFSFVLQALLTALEQGITRLFPFADETLLLIINASKLIPGLFIFGALYLLFLVMTPRRYRGTDCRKWPGPLFVAVWWLVVTSLLPPVLSLFSNYDLTYGGLAGVTITLIYFFTIGLGLVFGAHLNAALAVVPESALKGRDPSPEEGVT